MCNGCYEFTRVDVVLFARPPYSSWHPIPRPSLNHLFYLSGMDKMLVSPDGDVTITNDGATILSKMQVRSHYSLSRHFGML